MNLEALRTRSLRQLSHGELRRAWTALALAQRPDVLLLDEPTAFLDIAHQFELLDLLSELTAHGVTIVISMHDLWMTAIYCERIIALREGRIVASGPAAEVMTVEMIRDVFGVEAAVRDHPAGTARLPMPYARVKPPLPEAELARQDEEKRPSPHV